MVGLRMWMFLSQHLKGRDRKAPGELSYPSDTAGYDPLKLNSTLFQSLKEHQAPGEENVTQ